MFLEELAESESSIQAFLREVLYEGPVETEGDVSPRVTRPCARLLEARRPCARICITGFHGVWFFAPLRQQKKTSCVWWNTFYSSTARSFAGPFRS